MALKWLVTLCIVMMVAPSKGTGLCRDRMGFQNRTLFERRACAMCYFFLFAGKGKDLVLMLPKYDALLSKNMTMVTNIREAIEADSRNQTSVDRVCSTLSQEECTRWQTCCGAGYRCCDAQLATGPYGESDQYCPRTWDGYSCWKDTPAGKTVTLACPTYIKHGEFSGVSRKQCHANGTWYRYNGDGDEWTDYTNCVEINSHIVGVWIAIWCNVASLIMLFPAIAIMTSYRDLRKQDRIKIHINFFLALAMNGLFNVVWYSSVHLNVLVADNAMSTVLYQNPVWCRMISFLKLYFKSSTYIWMLCEGFYLYRLMANAFSPPKNITIWTVLGWATPFVPMIIYAIIRIVSYNERCWAVSVGALQWIIYAPNLTCLTINVIFLGQILRVLLFQLHSHPHEPSNFRRGLKAALMLVPLFGLQLFVTIYHPDPSAWGFQGYTYFTFIVQSTQGIFVTLIFCYFNGEVVNRLRGTFKCLPGAAAQRIRVSSVVTQESMMADDSTIALNRHRSSIPLRTNSYARSDNAQPENSDRKNVANGHNCGYTKLPTNNNQDRTTVF